MESNTKAIGATSSSTLGFENQGEQHVVTTKPTSPIRGGANLQPIPLFLLVMIIVVLIVVVAEPIVTPSLVISNRIKPLELLYITIPLTPPQISVGSEITLISSTLHTLKIFVTLTTSFINTHVQLVFTTKTSTQFMGSVEDVEEIGIKLVEETAK